MFSRCKNYSVGSKNQLLCAQCVEPGPASVCATVFMCVCMHGRFSFSACVLVLNSEWQSLWDSPPPLSHPRVKTWTDCFLRPDCSYSQRSQPSSSVCVSVYVCVCLWTSSCMRLCLDEQTLMLSKEWVQMDDSVRGGREESLFPWRLSDSVSVYMLISVIVIRRKSLSTNLRDGSLIPSSQSVLCGHQKSAW